VNLPVLTAVTGAPWESRVVTALERGDGGLAVVRRCVDLADLLAAAAAGHGRAVLLSADLRRLDRDALGRLAASGVAVVGVVAPGDEGAERRLRQLGVTQVVPADAGTDELIAAVHRAVGAPASVARHGAADPAAALRDLPELPEADEPPLLDLEPGSGRLVAVWGPTGAPGRTTVATTLAAEAAHLGRATLLADADTYGGAVAQVLGLLDEAPGLAAATRAANTGRLDLPGLARHARQVSPRLRVLSGIVRPDRWPELRPAALEVVWTLARGLAEVTVVDCGFSLEQDEELSFDTAAPRRNGATLATLEQADVVVVVGSADPVGLQRLVRGIGTLREVVPGTETRVVVNRVRRSVVGPEPGRQVRDALERYAGVQRAVLVPEDRSALDEALLTGRTLRESTPSSPALAALSALAAELVGHGEPVRGRRRRRAVVR
jgi:Flp pilus assembly CpaE family ATPase